MTNDGSTVWLVASPDRMVAGVGLLLVAVVLGWLAAGAVSWWLERHDD